MHEDMVNRVGRKSNAKIQPTVYPLSDCHYYIFGHNFKTVVLKYNRPQFYNCCVFIVLDYSF
ncbi:hypothetical protein Lalb_Chr22g0359031 [Lupinus albus]|uniref:Uncharacterized protein n=1 Tax=Lupinus albus TaxID=3870 RepID=A0A6A4NH21_LUPAL|nr:hypothetical protein Lalb_Chr22g0359031 [Lupinus albus]